MRLTSTNLTHFLHRLGKTIFPKNDSKCSSIILMLMIIERKPHPILLLMNMVSLSYMFYGFKENVA